MDEEEIKQRVIFGTGYGKPPLQSQFRKGQSGNPKGRPKGPSSTLSLTDQRTLAAVLAVAGKIVPVRDGGEMTEMSMIEAVIAATASSAVKGNARSQTTFISLTQRADAARARQIHDEIEFWSKYKSTVSAQLADAAKLGEQPPQVLPHPDDIVIDLTEGPRFLGPMEEIGQAMLDETILCRNALIMQDALDRRSIHRLDGTPLTEPGSAELLAMMLERAIPPRLRLSTAEWVVRAMTFEAMPKRQLLKRLYEGWHELRHPRPRGFVFPNLSELVSQLEIVAMIVNQIHIGRLDPLRMTASQLEEVVSPMMCHSRTIST